jgi:predicted XRE-type DNA-binding protein
LGVCRHSPDDGIVVSLSRKTSMQTRATATSTSFLNACLACEVTRVVKERRWTASDVSRTFGLPEDRVSALLYREPRAFTIDELVQMLGRAGVEVELTKHSPVDEETFDGPLCRSSGPSLYDTLRARLAAMLIRAIETYGTRRAMAEEPFGVAPAALAEIVAGGGSGVTIETLLEMLATAGVQVMVRTV